MTPVSASADDGSRRAEAAAAADRLLVIVRSAGPDAVTWYRQLLGIRDLLASDEPDEEALPAAAGMFGALYEGPRNFSDFHIWNPDERTRIEENKRVEDAVRVLRESLEP